MLYYFKPLKEILEIFYETKIYINASGLLIFDQKVGGDEFPRLLFSLNIYDMVKL